MACSQTALVPPCCIRSMTSASDFLLCATFRCRAPTDHLLCVPLVLIWHPAAALSPLPGRVCVPFEFCYDHTRPVHRPGAKNGHLQKSPNLTFSPAAACRADLLLTCR